jgi:hypothetical protein
MSQLQSLRAAFSLHHVAALLQFKPKALAFILYKKPPVTKYRSFGIAKRRGGVRQIDAPSPELKLLQRRVSDLLLNCMDEISSTRKVEDHLAHGFKRRRSIITNATKHRNRRYVFNIDLQDFFPTINFGRIRGFFIKDANFMLHPSVATVLAQIACHNNGLPQGSPCSPVISNLVGHVLDIHLCKLASANGCTYSRYADDITFSTNKPDFPPSVAKPIPGEPHKWTVGDRLQEIVTRAGFAINPQKTRMQYHTSHQDVTGLVVNRKVNIPSEYRRTARAMAQHLFMTGQFELIRTIPDRNGVLVPTKIQGTIPQLHGMLGHINAVDCHNAEVEAKGELGEAKAEARLRSKEKLYRRFLIFKDFYAAPAPVIVCEGKTDNVYLVHAIRRLAPNYPKLATVAADGKISLKIRILKTQSSTGRILQLGKGAADLDRFISHYLDESRTFKAPGMQHAVVLLVDNDQGAAKILLTINKITKKQASRTEPYIYISRNLYLVMTPCKQGTTESAIEDCFTDAVKKVNLGGKSFSAQSKPDPAKHFGKEYLARYVRENATKIDFSGFAGILDRISAAIEAHQSKYAQPATAAVVV